MTIKRDYYEILGIDRSASSEEIKKAYRDLALQTHPDRVAPDKKKEAEERFKEISEAYAVLSDPKKKATYDQFGHAGIDGQYTYQDIFRGADFGNIFGGRGFEDILRGFGSGGTFTDIFSDLFGTRVARRPRRGADLEYLLDITLEEAVRGCEQKIDIYHTITCPTCRGSGAKPGTGKKTCSQCQGQGQVRQVTSSIFGQFATVNTCSRCHGAGEVVEEVCHQCHGRGKVKKASRISLKIPSGVDSGTSIRVKGKGEAGELGGPSGDLYVVTRVKSHRIFEREGNDLICEVPLSFITAVLGGEIEVPTLEAKAVMKIPPGTQTDRVFRLRGKGVPFLHGHGKGDEYVKVIIKVPTRLNEKQKEILKEFAKAGGEKLSVSKKGVLDKIRDTLKGKEE
ncbi:MAG TPA: molecular chaperone DnaJ [bacterium]|nr:molecular chaperone DnaJ [bacterium]